MTYTNKRPSCHDHRDWLPESSAYDFSSSSPLEMEYSLPQTSPRYYFRASSHDTSFNSRQSTKPSASTYVPPYARADRWRPSSSSGQYRATDSTPRTNSRDHDSSCYSRPTPHYSYPPSSYGREWNSRMHYHSESYDQPHGLVNRGNLRTPSSSRDHDQAEAKIMPKHFNQPLTCFYWATQGECRKTDEECWYAHYHTGVVAGAPIKIDQPNQTGASHAVAGAKATVVIEDHALREKTLRNRESAQIAREHNIAAQEEAIAAGADNLREAITGVFSALTKIDSTASNARGKLENSRSTFTRHTLKFQDTSEPVMEIDSIGNSGHDTNYPDEDAETQIFNAVECAIEALDELEKEALNIKKQMEIKMGACQTNLLS